MYLNYICCIFLVCCRFSQATLTANNVTGYGRETTLFTWSSLGIRPGDLYSITKDLNVIYFSIDEGIIKEGKYSAIAENGAITLTILNTNVSDVGVYECSHNFTQASGFLAVAFRPDDVTAVATKLTDEWRMTVSATLVFPMDSAISSVTCSKADSSIAVFGTKSNAVSPNSDTSYLYDIAWNGTTTEILPEQTQCNITLNIIETVVRTIDVSFKGTSISTISTPNSTIDSPPDDCKICVWCVITPWWLCIVLIVLGILGGGCIVGAIVYKCCISTPPKWPCSSRYWCYSKPTVPEGIASASHVEMSGNSSENSNDVPKGHNGNNSGNETSRETKPPRRTIHDDNQGNGQSIRANGPNALPPMTGYSKVRPYDNQLSGDPDKNTPNNEANYTPRPLPILPNIRSSQAPNIDDVETETLKKKKKRKETEKDQIV